MSDGGEVGPPHVVKGKVGLTLPRASFTNGVEHGVWVDEVVAADEMPIEQPLDFVEGEPPTVGSADFGQNPASVPQTSAAGGGLGCDAVGAFHRGWAVGLDVAPDHILSGHLEQTERREIVALRGMPSQLDAVSLAPLRLGCVEDVAEATLDRVVETLPKSLGSFVIIEPERG